MNNKLFLLAGLLLCFFAATEAKATAPECKLVTTQQIGMGFINGVSTSPSKAERNAKKLSTRLHRPVTLFYNHTEGLTLDLLEAFEQITAELPPALRGRYELYHEFLLGGGELSASLTEAVPGLPKSLRLFSARHATAFALKGSCIKEGVSINDSEEILQRNGSVYQASVVTRDPVTGQSWRTVSRCVSGGTATKRRTRTHG